ncbi:D-alanyl-D-alanine carboxypeptidase [Streptomyces fructofermentans]|uniref:D-alanyl-D-alanine carboxypeptidase n=1 Tax=Streptomyces fructofermentans TaxID=152141 RepID=UPI0033CCCFF1
MAGESPDRSKQHESSAEPASGSTAPVPDPRLAVARETVTAASRTDTATAVFSTKGATTGPAKGAEGSTRGSAEARVSGEGRSRGSDGSAEPAGPADGPEAPEPAEPADGTDRSDSGEGPVAGDARLREAVAAWVSGTGGEAPEGTSGAGDGDSEAAPAPDAEDTGEAAGEAAEGSGAARDADAEADSGADADIDADIDGDSGTDAVPGADAEDSSAEGGSARSAGNAEGTATAATTATAEDGPGDAEGDADAAPAASKSDSASGADTDTDTDAESDAGTGSASDTGTGTGTGTGADSAAVGDEGSDSEPAGGARSEEPDAPDGSEGGAARETGAATGGRPGAGADSHAKPSADEPDAGPEADEADETDGATAGKPRVDQPTAVFKVRPPAVDQPTTMLKLGDARPAAGRAGSDARTGAEAGGRTAEKPRSEPPAAPTAKPSDEPVAERTSKFVALKPLDEQASPTAAPAARGPVPAAAETAVVPQIGPERTTQQPLPPKPPLDLLAELTNTPPPAQTPVRTLLRRVKIWTPLVLLLVVVFAVAQAVRPLPTPELTLTADESYRFEGDKASLPWPDEGQGWMDVNGIGTVDTFGEQKPVAIGSVAKAMTAYVILKEHPLKAGEDGESIPVDAKAETEGGYDKDGESTLNTVKEGDTLTEKDALAAIMIPSANNIARLLARWDSGGSEDAFVDKMNAAAEDLGMKNTTYTDPSGLKETTVSTAEDQVKLGNELVRMKALVDITKLPSWVDPSGKKWDNYNRLVPYNNAIGIKTGSTTKAGGNLLFAATQEVGGENVIVVGAILGQHTPPIIDTVNAVSKEAMIAAQEALTSRKILKKGDVVGYVDDGLGGRTPVVATKDVSAVGWAGQTVRLKLGEDGTKIPHEAKAGTVVGTLSVGGGTTGDAVEVPVALQSDLTEPGYGTKVTRIL